MKYFAPIFAAAMLAASSAYAFPAATPSSGAQSADSGMLIKTGWHHRYHHGRYYHDRGWYGRHYRYHYNYRPRDWHSRGCIR